MTVNGVVYIDGANDLTMQKDGSDKTINYTGSGSFLVNGNINVDVDLVTAGNNSYPNNII